MKQIQTEDHRIKRSDAKQTIETIFKMCSTELFDAFCRMEHTPKDMISTEKSSEQATCAENLAKEVIEQIFEANQEIEVEEFNDKV